MHLMTRLPEGARIRAPFDGQVFRFKDDAARLTQEDGARFVDLTSATGGHHRYRVTRVVGGRYGAAWTWTDPLLDELPTTVSDSEEPVPAHQLRSWLESKLPARA